MESFHTGILAQYLWWHDWDECVRGIHRMPRLPEITNNDFA